MTTEQAFRQTARSLHPAAVLTTRTGVAITLDESAIVSFRVREGADAALTAGNVLSATFSMEVAASALGSNDAVGGTLQLFLHIYNEGTEEVAAAGVFIVDAAELPEQSAVATLSGADALSSETSAAFSDTLTYPQTLQAVWSAAVAQTRFTHTGSIPNGTAVIDRAPDWGGASVRTVLGWVAQAAGCFVRLDRAGALTISPCLSAAAVAVTSEAYMTYTPDSRAFGPVDGLKIVPEADENGISTPFTVGTAAHATLLTERNPLFMEGCAHLRALAQGMLSCLSGLTLSGAKLRWRGDPAVTVGTRLTLTDTGGTARTHTVTRQTLKWSGGFSAEIECDVPDADTSGRLRAITPEGGVNGAALVGTVDGGLLSVGSIVTRSLSAGCVTAEKLGANSFTAETAIVRKLNTEALTALTAKLGEIAAGRVTTDALYAAFLSCVKLCADAGSFTFAEVQHLLANTLFVTQGTGGKVTISNLSVGEANIVNLSVGDLCLRDADGVLRRVYLDNGQITVGDAMADGTLPAAKLVQSSVTTGQLNAAEIFAVNGSVMSLIAGHITADEAFVGNVRTTAIGAVSDALTLYVRRDEMETYARLNADGVYIGQSGSALQARVAPGSFDVMRGSVVTASLGDRVQRIGRLRIFETSDGGCAFTAGLDG